MATLTETQVLGDIRRMLLDSPIAGNISGGVYLGDGVASTRPRDSQKEDAEIVFVSGLPDQIDTGVVLVKVYTMDVDPYGNGVFVADFGRIAELQALAQAWVETLTAEKSCYKFRLQQAISTEADTDIRQHYVVVRLHYEYFNE